MPELEWDKSKTEDLPTVDERPKNDEQRKSEKQSSWTISLKKLTKVHWYTSMCESETFHWCICAQKVIANYRQAAQHWVTKGLGKCPVHKQCYTAGHGLQSQPEPFHDQCMLYRCLSTCTVHTTLFIGVVQSGTCRQLMVYTVHVRSVQLQFIILLTHTLWNCSDLCVNIWNKSLANVNCLSV